MTGVTVARGVVFTELLWKLPHNVHDRKGRILLVGGSPGKLKELLEIAESTLQFQVAEILFAVPEQLAHSLPAVPPEVHIIACPETPAGSLGRVAKDRILTQAGDVDLALVGPGLSRHPETQQMVRELVGSLSSPLALTQDGLPGIDVQTITSRKAGTVLVTDASVLGRLLHEAGLVEDHGAKAIATLYKHKNELLFKAAQAWQTNIVLISSEPTVAGPSVEAIIIPGLHPDQFTAFAPLFWGLYLALAIRAPDRLAEVGATSLSALNTYQHEMKDAAAAERKKVANFRTFIDKASSR